MMMWVFNVLPIGLTVFTAVHWILVIHSVVPLLIRPFLVIHSVVPLLIRPFPPKATFLIRPRFR